MLNGEVSAYILKTEKLPFRRITSKEFPCKFPVFFQSDLIGFVSDFVQRAFTASAIGGGMLNYLSLSLAVFWAFLSFLSFSPVRAEGAVAACLSDAELRDLVNSGQIVPQIYAFRTARTQTGGEVVRASLCPKEAELVYMITTLSKDGKLNRIDISAVTGKPLTP